MDRIADELSLYFQDRTWRIKVKPQTISNLIWAYAALKRCPQKLNQVRRAARAEAGVGWVDACGWGVGEG